ncbi:MAG: sodium:alanine symporter family protein [Treponema sp.]|nr:sodium:alanine symporter family protein [Treponema sp.]
MTFFEAVQKVNNEINGLVWGPPMLVLIVGTGIFLTIISKVFQISKIKVWWKGTFGQLFKKSEKIDDSNITPFQAVTTALASTVGTGNVVGVATAIFAGGPGAVLWMWVSGFFGMMTKYAEVVLAVKYREADEKGAYHGGPMYYIQNGLGPKMKWLAVIFAVFGTFATFGIGNMTQANAIASSLDEVFNIPPLAAGIAITIIIALVIIGGIKRIALVTEKLVPLMCIFYVIGSVIILVLNAGKLGGAFSLIFSNAFSLQSVGSGIMGYVIMLAMRYGIARGVFSNEAGLGSAPIAHAASRSKDPVQQGLWGVFEVFIDTIVICTLTALVIVTSGLYTGDIKGVPLVMASFSNTFGSFGGVFIAIGILTFACSTILGWSYYGQQCLGYLTKNNKAWDMAYKVIFALLAIVGATGGLTFVWDVADTLNGLMAIPNLIALLLLSKVVLELTKEYLAREK